MGDTISIVDCSAHAPEKPEEDDQTRMFRLLEQGEQGKLESLLRTRISHVDLNRPSERGETALHVAARKGHLPICKMLVSCGASTFAVNSENQTPHDVAKARNNKFCEAFLNAQNRRNSIPRSTSEHSQASTVDDAFIRSQSTESKDDDFSRAQSQMSTASTQSRRAKLKAWASGWLSQGKKDDIIEEEKAAQKSSHKHSDDIPAIALYSYDASNITPYPPDNRLEMNLILGEIYMVEEILPDGWAIIRKRGTKHEGYCPGNYLSLDGKHAMVDEHGLPYCTICKRHRKAGHNHAGKKGQHKHHQHHHNLTRLTSQPKV